MVEVKGSSLNHEQRNDRNTPDSFSIYSKMLTEEFDRWFDILSSPFEKWKILNDIRN